MPGTRNSAKRVLMVAADFKPLTGGVAEFAYHMARGFTALDAEVLILSPCYSGLENYDDKLGLQIIRTHPAFKPGRILTVVEKIKKCASLASLAATMLRLRKAFAPHILYLPSMYPFAGFFPYSKGNIITTFHGRELSIRCQRSRAAALNRCILARSCSNSALILANSSYTQNLLIDLGIDDSKIFVTGCGVDWDRFSNIPATEQAKSGLGLSGKKVIFSLGRLDERKGFDSVLKCIAHLRKKFPDILYVIAGKGPMKADLKKLTALLDLRDYVRMPGSISDKAVIDYMAACDIFAMPNRETSTDAAEGFGIVLLEANCCGKPVVAGRSGGVVDAVEHNKTGLLVDPYSLQSIEEAIETLLGRPQFAAKLGQQGRQRAEKHFKWTYIAERACREVLQRAG